MLKRILLPPFGAPLASVTVHAVHAQLGHFLEAGDGLVDLTVEFDGGAANPCPPISHYRLITRDAGWLSGLGVSRGDVVEPGTLLATLSTEAPDEDGEPRDKARVNLAAVLVDDNWWSDP